MFEPFIRPIKGSINLGDARTTHSSVSDVVILKPSFADDDLQEHRETVELVVFETGSHIIIGLADIARTFGTLFIKMIQKAMDSPTPLHRSRARPSAQTVINHSYWSNQSLLMLSNSESESDEEFLSGIRLIVRCSDWSDDDSSGPIDDIVYESYDGSSDNNVTIPDPVYSDLWIEQWDIREEEDHLSRGHSNDCSTSVENSDIEVVMYYDSGENESTISSSDSSNEDIPVFQYHSTS